MRNFSKLIFQRVVVVSLGILLQIIFVLAGMSWLHEYRRWLGFAMTVLSWGAVITVICSHGNPSYKIAWAVLILAFPVAGLTIYLLFGGNRVSSHEARKMAGIERVTTNALTQDPEVLAQIEARGDDAYNHARRPTSGRTQPISRAASRALPRCWRSLRKPNSISSSNFSSSATARCGAKFWTS